MQTILEKLFELLGSHFTVAELVQYSERQYLNIRQRLARGEALNPRIELWRLTKDTIRIWCLENPMR
jgi:hypothetical protein